MSDALNYLLKVRPEAMGAYFSFLKQVGTHLDIKTRDLISVITKVAVQTEAGFKQYVRRALRNGASAQEILDALLMAFPALGLAKIVWAVDLLLQMDLPEFHPDRLDASPEWRDLGALDDFPVGETRYLSGKAGGFFVYRSAEAIRVYEARCPHQGTSLTQADLNGTQLTCPKHRWAFDLPTGACIARGNQPLRHLPHRVEGDRLQVYR